MVKITTPLGLSINISLSISESLRENLQGVQQVEGCRHLIRSGWLFGARWVRPSCGVGDGRQMRQNGDRGLERTFRWGCLDLPRLDTDSTYTRDQP